MAGSSTDLTTYTGSSPIPGGNIGSESTLDQFALGKFGKTWAQLTPAIQAQQLSLLTQTPITSYSDGGGVGGFLAGLGGAPNHPNAFGKIAGAGGSAATTALSWTDGLTSFFDHILSVGFWERVGYVVGGVLIIWIGLRMRGRNSNMPTVPKPPIIPIPV